MGVNGPGIQRQSSGYLHQVWDVAGTMLTLQTAAGTNVCLLKLCSESLGGKMLEVLVLILAPAVT